MSPSWMQEPDACLEDVKDITNSFVNHVQTSLARQPYNLGAIDPLFLLLVLILPFSKMILGPTKLQLFQYETIFWYVRGT